MKVLKIGAVWCSGCVIMKPRWKEIEQENPWLKAEYIDFDTNQNLVQNYDVKDLPCFIFLNERGEEIERLTGEVKKSDLVEKINKHKDT